MALKNTDRVTSKNLRAGHVVLTTPPISDAARVRPAETLTGNAWRTVADMPTSELQYGAGRRRATRFYSVTFTDGTRAEGLAPGQHWTRQVPDPAAVERFASRLPIAAEGLATRADLVDASASLDDHAVIDGPEDDGGERCGTCKGFGLVRGIGSHAGGRYKTLAGAQAAQGAGRAVDCPTCEGTGLDATVRELVTAGRVDSMDAMITAVLDDPAHFQIITVGR